MTFFSSSRGITRNQQLPFFLDGQTIQPRYHWARGQNRSVKNQAVFIGWGYKPNTLKTRQLAQQHQLPYWALEDGFIAYAQHPSNDKKRLSLIIDRQGIYYDCHSPSGLDDIIQQTQSFDESRSRRLLQQLNHLKVSKYNQPRANMSAQLQALLQQKNDYLLLVDQTHGDASIECAGGSDDDFQRMFNWALEILHEQANTHVVIKTHPDVVLGNKQGYLANILKCYLKNDSKDSLKSSVIKSTQAGLSQENISSRLHLISEDVCPASLIAGATQVATVSSQLGFEALWQDKPVHCFAWPFYAGRGLTHDHAKVALPYARPASSLLKLMHCALIVYPKYLHPDTQKVCQVEQILDYLQAHFLARQLHSKALMVRNVSLWKRSFIPAFLASSVDRLRYQSGDVPLNTVQKNTRQLLWGMKNPQQTGEHVWRMEDGFIRSVGLGADLRRPTSLVLDDAGIYYNGKQSSRLEQLLNTVNLNEYETHRVENLITLVKQSAITKYNVESSDGTDLRQKLALPMAPSQEIILVTGQFQQDLSMQYGAIDICDNLSLLKKVREQFPQAFIIYKEHPDVYSGVRPGKLDNNTVLQLADRYVTHTSLIELFAVVDRVCTICSLAGFEALIRGVKVSTYGLPFYAGWGLTEDLYSFARRKATLSLQQLVYATLVLYPRYVNWNTRQLSTPESTIAQLQSERQQGQTLNSSWLARQVRKTRYLSQAILARR